MPIGAGCPAGAQMIDEAPQRVAAFDNTGHLTNGRRRAGALGRPEAGHHL